MGFCFYSRGAVFMFLWGKDFYNKCVFIFSFLLVAQSLYANEFKSDKTYEPRLNHDDGIHFESFIQNIKDHNVTTLEQALALVPETFYNNYVLMYRSRSLQDASPIYPRAILFGRTAKFIMAFNGHEEQKGFNNLEMIQYREATNKWEFRELTFFKDKAPVVSEANPKKCLECHQSPKRQNIDPRPNWEPYNFWPGAYASVDDTLDPVLKKPYQDFVSGEKNYLIGTLARFLPQDFILVEEQSHELENLRHFFSTLKSSHPRYQFLKEFNKRDPLHLTKATVALNMRRVARLIKEELGESLFSIYKYAVIGIAHVKTYQNSNQLRFACNELYLPPSLLDRHLNKVRLHKSIPEQAYRRTHQGASWDLSFEAATDILMTPFGINTDDWSMDFKTDGRFSVLDRFSSPHHSQTQFRDALESVYAGDPALQMPCAAIKEESLRSLSLEENVSVIAEAMSRSQDISLSTPQRPLIQRCISCHVHETYSEQAPFIPFDDFSRLKPLLDEAKYSRGTLYQEILYRISDHVPLKDQMPPSGGVDREQRDTLIEQLSNLKEL